MPSIEQLTKLLDADPRDPFLLYGMAQELARAGDHAAAVRWYDRCLEADPGYCYAYYHKARSLAALGDTPAALAAIATGKAAAQRAGDGHALSELSGLEMELA